MVGGRLSSLSRRGGSLDRLVLLGAILVVHSHRSDGSCRPRGCLGCQMYPTIDSHTSTMRRDTSRRCRKGSTMEDWNNRKMAKECTPDEMSTLMGGRRARRWRNEKALRDLAGPMSAEHMASLFSPAPFGVQYDSAWTVAMHPDNLPLWEEFISIDMDEESTVLAKTRTKPCSTRDPLCESRNSWQRMGSRYRRILCRAATREPSLVKRLEDVIIHFDYSLKEEQVVQFDSRFERLIFQGLCDYHDAFYRTSNVVGESAQVGVWTRRWQNLDLLARIPCTDFLAHIGKIDPGAPMSESKGFEQGWVVLNGH